jgi:sulfur carrier protein ThiS
MVINITLHGILRDYLPRQARGKTSLTLPAGTTIADVVAQLEIKHNVSAAINGDEVDTSYILQDGQGLDLFRLIAGG